MRKVGAPAAEANIYAKPEGRRLLKWLATESLAVRYVCKFRWIVLSTTPPKVHGGGSRNRGIG